MNRGLGTDQIQVRRAPVARTRFLAFYVGPGGRAVRGAADVAGKGGPGRWWGGARKRGVDGTGGTGAPEGEAAHRLETGATRAGTLLGRGL